VRARPDPKQKWKLPVKYWIHDLRFSRFGFVIGEKPLPVAPPTTPEEDEAAMCAFEQEMYWDDYSDRNPDSRAPADDDVPF
jgi:hypothetical protein